MLVPTKQTALAELSSKEDCQKYFILDLHCRAYAVHLRKVPLVRSTDVDRTRLVGNRTRDSVNAAPSWRVEMKEECILPSSLLGAFIRYQIYQIYQLHAVRNSAPELHHSSENSKIFKGGGWEQKIVVPKSTAPCASGFKVVHYAVP